MTIHGAGAIEAQDDRADRLHDHANAIRELGKRAVDSIIEIERHLTEAQKIAGHGNWLPWLDREFGWKEDSARRYMRVFELSKSSKLRDLNVPVSALYLLTAPSTPSEVRNEVLERAAAGEKISLTEVKAAIAESKSPAGDLDPELEDPDPELKEILAARANHTIVNGTPPEAVTGATASGEGEPEIEPEPEIAPEIAPKLEKATPAKVAVSAQMALPVLIAAWQVASIEKRSAFLAQVGEQDLRKALPDEVRRALEQHFRGNQKRQQRARKKTARVEKKYERRHQEKKAEREQRRPL